jgi:tripartite-type tricarboxylate transporter receptor subunit TctC
MNFLRRQFLHLARGAVALPAVSRLAEAQAYPSRPITMIEPFGVSSTPDILVRTMAPRLSELVSQPVVVENVVGAGGNDWRKPSGARRPRRLSHRDQRHLCADLQAGTFQAATIQFRDRFRFNYAALRAASAPGHEQQSPGQKSAGIHRLRQANQAQMKFGSLAGTGSANHVICEFFDTAIGVNVLQVPYRPPSSTAYQDLITGRIDYMCPLASGDAKSHIDSGQFKGIAIFSKRRSPILPDLPTADEQGLAGFEGKVWYAFFAPKGTPPAIIQKLHDAMNDAVETPEIKTRLEQYGAELVSPERRSPEYLQNFVESEIKKWAAVIKVAGIEKQ